MLNYSVAELRIISSCIGLKLSYPKYDFNICFNASIYSLLFILAGLIIVHLYYQSSDDTTPQKRKGNKFNI